MSELTLISGAMALAFAAVHLFIPQLATFSRKPRNRFLSFAGGVAVAYVFLHILPELAAHGANFATVLRLREGLAESSVYALALLGLAVFYGIERAASVSKTESEERGEGRRIGMLVLGLHLAANAVINLLIGYLLLHREQAGVASLAFYFVAMALQFATADVGMRADHPQAYDRFGRWIIAGAVLAGWVLGLVLDLDQAAIGMIFAFVAGGIVLIVLKEELPEERESRLLPFLIGATLYGALIFGELIVA